MRRRALGGDWRWQARSPGRGHGERKGEDTLARRIAWMCGHTGGGGAGRTQDAAASIRV